MLIGIDATPANRKFKSGTEWYAYNLIRQLAQIDSKNQYVLYSDRPLTGGLSDLRTDASESAEIKINQHGCQEIKSPHNNFKVKILNWPWKHLWTQGRLSWEMLRRPPDVLFVPAHVLPLIHPKNSVTTIHDIGFERNQELYEQEKIGPQKFIYKKIVSLLFRLLTRNKFRTNVLDYHSWSVKFALKYARAVITVSNFTKNEINEVYGNQLDKIKVVYNGFNDQLYKKNIDQAKIGQVLERYGVRQPYIFYVGRLEKKKNSQILVNAFAILKQRYKEIKHKLVLAGNAGLGFDEIKYTILEFDLSNEVMITGWVPEADLPYLFAGASLFIFPSLYEGFGIPLLEAMSASVPIICSRAGSLPEVAAEAALYFDPRDKNEIAEIMRQVLVNKNLANDLVAKGNERVKHFSLDKCARETLKVIEAL